MISVITSNDVQESAQRSKVSMNFKDLNKAYKLCLDFSKLTTFSGIHLTDKFSGKIPIVVFL